MFHCVTHNFRIKKPSFENSKSATKYWISQSQFAKKSALSIKKLILHVVKIKSFNILTFAKYEEP